MRASSCWCRLWRESPCQAFFDEAVYPIGKSRQVVVKGFKLQQQSCCLGCLRQMETKSGSVWLYIEQACCGFPILHLGSSSAFKYRLLPLLWHDHHSWSACIHKLTLNPTSFLGDNGLVVSHVQTVTNSPLAFWYVNVESIKPGTRFNNKVGWNK